MFNIQYKGIKITKCKKYINLKQNKKKNKQTNNQDTPNKRRKENN